MKVLAGIGLSMCMPFLAPAAEPVLAAAPADLTELSLQELMAVKVESVSTASRYTQQVSEAPASVTVITSEEIKLYGYRTLADVLRSVRGLYVTYDRTYSYLGLRGFSRPSDYNSRVLIMVDGHRINDALFGGGYIGREFVLDVDLIDRVELVRGPTSSLYGSGAFFGVINVFTKRPADLKTAEASTEIGGFESYKGRFSVATVLTNIDARLMLSGSIYESQGDRDLYFAEFDTPASNNGIAHKLDHEQAWNLYGSAEWKELTLSGAFVSRRKDIPTASWGTLFNDPRYHTVDEHGYADLKWLHPFDDQEVMARVYFDDVRYTADYPYAAPVPGNASLTRDDDLAQTVGGEAQWTWRWQPHVFTVGTEVRGNPRQNQSYYDVEPSAVYLDDRRSLMEAAVYAQSDFAICTNLHLNAGVRYDYYESFGSTVNPRAALIYKPWEPTALKFLYGTAFRAPNMFELYYETLPDNLGNSELKPEKIQTYEIVLEQSLPADLKLTLNGYYYHIDDLINQVQVTPIPPALTTVQFQNTGEADAQGVETELEWHPAFGLRARASYALQHAENATTQATLENSPRHLAKANLMVPLWRNKIFTGIEAQYSSHVKTLAGANADGFYVVNWTLYSQRIIRGLEFSASLYNLFDSHYAFPGGQGHVQDLIRQDGRSFRVKLTYRF